MIGLGARPALLASVPAWVLKGDGTPATLDFDFVNHRYFQQGRPSNIEALLTTSRASTGYVDYVNGIWRPIAANLPRISDKGLLVEEGRTNDALWCRDLTKAAWVKANATAALDQVGIDGLANSASSLTATAGNGTVLQTITLASQADTYSVFVKRITGTGEIDITINGGTTWTALSPAPSTTVWTRYQVTATLANPVFGLRVVTNGDKIAVDFNQLEPGGFATSPILTTTAAATRAADVIKAFVIPLFGLSQSAVVFGVANAVATSSLSQILLQMDDGTASNRIILRRLNSTGNYSGAIVSNGVALISADLSNSWITGIRHGLGICSTTGSQAVAAGSRDATNAIATSSASNTVKSLNEVQFGSGLGSLFWNGYIERSVIFSATRISNAEILKLVIL